MGTQIVCEMIPRKCGSGVLHD